jgi:hypothetical protein
VDSASVLARVIVNDLQLPDSTKVELIVHQGRLNWRQQNTAPEDKLRNLTAGLAQPGPLSGQLSDISSLDGTLRTLTARITGTDVISATSRLFDTTARFIGHLAIMNLHTDAISDLDRLISVLRETTGGVPGYLLTSGRFYHYYGSRLLTEQEWLKFLAQFLMPCILVSPRYIGHSLFSGFCSVRLTRSNPHKPVVPTLITTI